MIDAVSDHFNRNALALKTAVLSAPLIAIDALSGVVHANPYLVAGTAMLAFGTAVKASLEDRTDSKRRIAAQVLTNAGLATVTGAFGFEMLMNMARFTPLSLPAVWDGAGMAANAAGMWVLGRVNKAASIPRFYRF